MTTYLDSFSSYDKQIIEAVKHYEAMDPETTKSTLIRLFDEMKALTPSKLPTSDCIVKACLINIPAALQLLNLTSTLAKEDILSSFKKEELVSTEGEKAIALKISTLAVNIHRKALIVKNKIFDNTQESGIKCGFKRSLISACFLSMHKTPHIQYFSNTDHGLPYSMLVSRQKGSLLFPLNAKNLIERGTVKSLYPALYIDMETFKVKISVQIIPHNTEMLIIQRSFTIATQLGTAGSGFPEVFIRTNYNSKKFKKCIPILIQKYWPDRDLLYFMNRKGLVTPGLLQQIAFNLSKNIRDIHRQNALHNDVKLENCLSRISKYPKKSEVTSLSDFDFYQKIDDNSIALKSYGTTELTSPEILKNPNLEKKSRQPSDMYAFGIVLFTLITNEYPHSCYYLQQIPKAQFQENTQDNKRYKQRAYFEQNRLSEFLHAVSKKTPDLCWAKVLIKLLHVDSKQRMTADEFHEMINGISAPLPIPDFSNYFI